VQKEKLRPVAGCGLGPVACVLSGWVFHLASTSIAGNG